MRRLVHKALTLAGRTTPSWLAMRGRSSDHRGMAKYDPLSAFLQLQREDESVMTFDEIELVLGSTLPASAKLPQWWANEGSQSAHVQRAAWRDAGFQAFLIKGESKVRFVRARRL